MRAMDKICNYSPLIMQNIMISAYSYHLKCKRYGVGSSHKKNRTTTLTYVDLAEAVAKHASYYIDTEFYGSIQKTFPEKFRSIVSMVNQ